MATTKAPKPVLTQKDLQFGQEIFFALKMRSVGFTVSKGKILSLHKDWVALEDGTKIEYASICTSKKEVEEVVTDLLNSL